MHHSIRTIHSQIKKTVYLKFRCDNITLSLILSTYNGFMSVLYTFFISL